MYLFEPDQLDNETKKVLLEKVTLVADMVNLPVVYQRIRLPAYIAKLTGYRVLQITGKRMRVHLITASYLCVNEKYSDYFQIETDET